MTTKHKISNRALSLVEMMVAMMVVMVALPPLIDAAMSMARWDRTRDLRSHATHFGQLALERAHHRLYDGDPRSFKLGAAIPKRLDAYAARPPAWQQDLAFPEGAVVDAPSRTGGASVTGPFGELYRRDGAPAGGLSEATHPELVLDVASYRVEQTITPLDGATLPALAAKGADDPRPDLVQVDTVVRWTDFRGGAREQRARTWRTRAVWEPDPRLSLTGGL